MNVFEFACFVILGAAVSLILNRILIKLRFATWAALISLTYNVLMIASYLDVAENKKLFNLQFDPSVSEHYPTLTIVSLIMMLFHCLAFRN